MLSEPTPEQPAGAEARPVLWSPRLLLRPFSPADAPAFVAAARESVASVGHWLGWCHADYSEIEALEWFAFSEAQAARGVAYEYGVFDGLSGRLLGGVGLNQIPAGLPVANLGYWVRASAQRQGLAPEAARALVAHGLARLGLQRIEVLAAVGNHASQRVALALGAQPEGLLRRRVPTPRGLEDACVFALIAGDAAAVVDAGASTATTSATSSTTAPPPGFAPRSQPGCYAVIFTSQRNGQDAEGYGRMADAMMRLAAQQPGYLGAESAREPDGLGLTVSYWRSTADILAWRHQVDHHLAREQGRAQWYAHYEMRIARVERAYGWTAPGPT